MEEMDSLGLKLFVYQARLFKQSSKLTDCTSNFFIRRFMNSNLSKGMDKKVFFI